MRAGLRREKRLRGKPLTINSLLFPLRVFHKIDYYVPCIAGIIFIDLMTLNGGKVPMKRRFHARFENHSLMKSLRHIVIVSACLLILTTGSSCTFFRNLFGPKYGCPSNGKNVGAERVLSGEKVPKARKFKS